jgi:hypothetical protein
MTCSHAGNADTSPIYVESTERPTVDFMQLPPRNCCPVAYRPSAQSFPRFPVVLHRHQVPGSKTNIASPGFGALLRVAIFLSAMAAWPGAMPIVARSETIGQNSDGTEPIWRLSGDTGRILASERVLGGVRADSRCERVVVANPVAQSAELDCPIAKYAVLDELEIRLWVKASHAGVQLAARVTMPRSVDQEGRPAVATVRAAVYDRPGHWQQLVLTNVPRLLADEVRLLRMTADDQIDPREGYVDSIALVVPGEPGGVEVFIDELEVDGIPPPEASGVQLASFPSNAMSARDPRPATQSDAERDFETAPRPSAEQTAVRLHGSVLTVEGRPFMPRAIEWQNEPFQFLAERGFNTIYLSSPPTADQVAEAKRHSLWLVCSPPRPDAITRAGLGQMGDRVIAWHLADNAVEADPEYGRNWAEMVRQHDEGGSRPIVMTPQADRDVARNTSDIALACHPRAAWMPPAHYDEWLESLLRSGTPDRPLWAKVPTQLGDQVSRQAAVLAGTLASPPVVDADQPLGLVEIACTRGCRGILFGSSSRLDEETPQARRRAATLELTNRRLQLIEPWIAGGKISGRVTSTDAAWTAIVLQVDHARLVVPITPRPAAREVTSTPAGAGDDGEVVFVVPGVPETSQFFWLSPAAFWPLRGNRIAGGTQITFPTAREGMLLITEDPLVIHSFRQRIARAGPEIVRLAQDLAQQRAKFIEEAERNLAQLGYHTGSVAPDVQVGLAQLRQSHSLLSARQIEAAYNAAIAANRSFLRVAAVQRAAIPSPVNFVVNPLGFSSDQRLEYGKFIRQLGGLRSGENRLYGGDFEDLDQMTQFGWAHVSRNVLGIESSAKLSAAEPKHGGHCLELSARATSAEAAAVVISGAPVWIDSPPIPVAEGQIVEITGWVRIDEPIVESIDGLQIVDSLGGPESTLAVRQTSGWEPFQLIRGVPESTELRLTFALSGFGTARIDGVMVRALEPPGIRRLPAVLREDRSAERSATGAAARTMQ